MYDIIATLNDLFSKPKIAAWLSTLSGTIYITKNDAGLNDPNNMAWFQNGHSYITVQPTDNFYYDAPRTIPFDPDGPGPAPVGPIPDPAITPTQRGASSALGYLDLGTAVMNNLNQAFEYQKPNQGWEWAGLARGIFHELTHAKTEVLRSSTYAYSVGSNMINYPAEAISIDAENLVFRAEYSGEPIRVGHGNRSFPLGRNANDPTLAFDTYGTMEFEEKVYDSTGNRVAVVRENLPDGMIEKIYGEKLFEFTTEIKTYNVNNNIMIQGISTNSGNNKIILDNGQAATLLATVEDGIAHDDVISSGVLTRLATQVNEINAIGDALALSTNPSLYRLTEISTLLRDIDHGTVTAVIGLSKDLSATDDVRTGPHELGTPSPELYIEATESGSLILGASGTSKTNVSYGSRTDYLRGSDGDDILIAGTGSAVGMRNVLEGKDRRDILIGRDKSDKLLGGAGSDILFLSKGQDILEGGSGADLDVLVVSENLGQVTVDLTNKVSGYWSFGVGSGTSQVKEVEVFVGNGSRTTFKGNAEGSVFIAGSGGANFYLQSGDQGIGHDGVEDRFYIDAGVGSALDGKTNAEKISYLESNRVYVGNFGPEDKIYIKKNGTYVLFNGNKVKTALLGEMIAPDWNRDDPHNAYVLTGDSAYGTAFANPTFEVRGASYFGEPWGALTYADMQYRDVNYTATSDGLGIINFFARGITGVENGGSSASAGQTGYTFNQLTAADEQLMVVIDGFQNGMGGITFENDGLANFRPGVPDSAGDDGYWPHTQSFATNWGEESIVGVSDEEDIFDGNVDGRMSPGGASVTPDDPRFNFGNLAFDGESVDWDDVLSGPRMIEGSGDADSLSGGWASDEIAGGDGDDIIYGGPGDDILDGGAGNDEIHGGSGNDTLLGGIGDDQLYGDDGSNTVDGGDGDDIAYVEGYGSDFRIYRKPDGTVVAEYLYGEGNIQTFTNVETLTFYDGSFAPDVLPMGTAGNDILLGSPGADLLDGGTGDDELAAGEGDDIYVIDSAGDVVTENVDEGIDTVRTTLSAYALGANVENLEFTGTGAFSGTGNDLDNLIIGSAGNDTLSGGAGYDRFMGLGGTDTIDGGDDEDKLVLTGKPDDYAYSIDGLGVVTISDGTNSV